MPAWIVVWARDAALLLALAGGAYLLVALRCSFRFRAQRHGTSTYRPWVTVMVPVCGAPPGLYECLRSLCEQDYPRMQIVFGLHDEGDPARAVIARVMAEHPQRDVTVVIDERRAGTNPKVCNLLNMYPAAEHDVIVMVDSDVLVDARFLEVMVESLRDPDVGAVTCLYQGAPRGGLVAGLGALRIDEWFIPSALVDTAMHDLEVCYGAVMAVHRHAFEAIGGLPALASAVAEDDLLGRRLHDAGFRIELSRYVVATTVTEQHLGTLWAHELRWLRSVRACRPLDHCLSLVTHPSIPVFLLLNLRGVEGVSWVSLGVPCVLLALRFALHFVLGSRIAPKVVAPWWMVPVRECLDFGLWVASFASRSMTWGERRLLATGSLRMSEDPTDGR